MITKKQIILFDRAYRKSLPKYIREFVKSIKDLFLLSVLIETKNEDMVWTLCYYNEFIPLNLFMHKVSKALISSLNDEALLKFKRYKLTDLMRKMLELSSYCEKEIKLNKG